jgi:hypothetical protein
MALVHRSAAGHQRRQDQVQAPLHRFLRSGAAEDSAACSSRSSFPDGDRPRRGHQRHRSLRGVGGRDGRGRTVNAARPRTRRTAARHNGIDPPSLGQTHHKLLIN